MAFDLSQIDTAFYSQAILSIGLMLSLFVLVINWKQNVNYLKLKLIPNSGIIRFKTPGRREEEVVVRLNDKVVRRKTGDKTMAYLVNPRRIFYKSTNPKSFKYISPEQAKDANDPNFKVTVKQLLQHQINNLTFSGKVPILEYRSDDANPIDPYDKNTMVSAELLEGMLVGAEATADLDFFKRLFGYKHIWQFAAAIAIGTAVSVFLTWQIMNGLNTNPYFLGELDICQIAADTSKIIVAGG